MAQQIFSRSTMMSDGVSRLHNRPVPSLKKNYSVLLPRIQCSWNNTGLSKNVAPMSMASSSPKGEHRTTIVSPQDHVRTCRTLQTMSAVPSGAPEWWWPEVLETDTEKESRLFQEMEISMQKFERSDFYCSFINQMQNPEMLNRFRKVLGSEKKMKMVIYGLGSIEQARKPRLQLSLALLMKRRFDWIGEIEVFDPILSMTECLVLTYLGCTVLTMDEKCRRKVIEPTLFFMPHGVHHMYENLLEANWAIDHFSRFIVLGNSFSDFAQTVADNKSKFVNPVEHILAAERFTEEFGVSTFCDDTYRAFNGTSWHFFNPADEGALHMMN